MENKKLGEANAQLAIAGQLYQRGLISQSEYLALKRMLTNHRLEISPTQDAISSSSPKKHRRIIKERRAEKE